MKEIMQLIAASQGATSRACDLHVHTPASSDMDPSWSGSKPHVLVELAIASGLEVIAVTDHNSVDWCDPVQEATEGTPLIALPGIEISTPEGHVLAVFDKGTEGTQLNEFLVQIGFRKEQRGDLNAVSARPIDEVAKAIEGEGGIAIAAHVDRERGFLQMVKTGARRREIRGCAQIRAFEVVDPALAGTHMRESPSGEQRTVACVQGSDSWPQEGDRHQLDAIGTRRCFVKMDHVSVRGLRQATMDPDLRILLGAVAPSQAHSVIEGMWMAGGFLAGQMLRFSDDVTCLIGDTGSGKSLTIELLRFALDQQVEPVLSKIHKEVSDLLAYALGEMDTVYVLLRKGAERYLVERPWLASDAPSPVVYRVEDGVPELLPDAIHMPSFFPLKGYSQSEIIEYAREPLARLSLIDRLIDTTAEQGRIEDSKTKLRANAGDLILLQDQLRKALEALKALPGLEEEVGRLAAFLQDPTVRQQETWEREQALLDAVESAFDEYAEDLDLNFPSVPVGLPSTADMPQDPINADLMNQAVELSEAARAAADEGQEDLVSKSRALRQAAAALRASWELRHADSKKKFAKAIAELGAASQGQAALLTKLTRLRKRADELEKVKRNLESKLRPRVDDLRAHREDLLTGLQGARKNLTSKRRKKADQLGSRLDNRVSIEVRHAGDSRDFKRSLMQLRQGSHVHEADIDVMASRLHPVPLVKSLIQGDFDGPAGHASLDAVNFAKYQQNVLDKGWLADLYELQLVELEDLVQVRFAVDKHTYKDLEALAHGQKCTVVLMISLAEGDFPLLVDQPEDALHAPWIESYIVSTLRANRGSRQCIFGTRSANVLVSADAEQVLALKADAHRGKLEKSGSIDRFDTRDLVLFHVEGGKGPFLRRQELYALDLP